MIYFSRWAWSYICESCLVYCIILLHGSEWWNSESKNNVAKVQFSIKHTILMIYFNRYTHNKLISKFLVNRDHTFVSYVWFTASYCCVAQNDGILNVDIQFVQMCLNTSKGTSCLRRSKLTSWYFLNHGCSLLAQFWCKKIFNWTLHSLDMAISLRMS